MDGQTKLHPVYLEDPEWRGERKLRNILAFRERLIRRIEQLQLDYEEELFDCDNRDEELAVQREYLPRIRKLKAQLGKLPLPNHMTHLY